MLEFLQMLTEHCSQDMDIFDRAGWTALYRASAVGTSGEVEALIAMGADPATVALPLKWNAIHHAVFYGNDATFEALLPYFDGVAIELVDERGWTLLHIAASAGHVAITRRLLQLGADPFALSQPFMSHMPECLYDKRCTPSEVAEAQSAERKERFLNAVREIKPSALQFEPVNLEGELFWDAEEVPQG